MTPLSLSLKPKHLTRYKDVVMLLLRHSQVDLASNREFEPILEPIGRDELEGSGEDDGEESGPERLARDLEQLGPTFIKLGQLLSTRSDLLPENYRKALTRLQDDVEQVEFATVQEIVERELGVRLSKAFASFEERPLASASLGQVHRATLLDGREVAVKVQRPDVRQIVRDDLEALDGAARFLENHWDVARRYRFVEIVESFRQSLADELDYRRERSHLERLTSNLEEFDLLRFPRVIGDYSSRAVLTMEYISGIGIDDVSQVVLTEISGEDLADTLFEAYLNQILVDGLFHADPHPGNLLLTADHRIGILDLGMVGYVPRDLRSTLLRLLLAVADGDGSAAAEIAIDASRLREDADPETFRNELSRRIQRDRDASVGQLEVGSIVIELSQLAAENGVLVPSILNLMAKALLNLDLIGRTLAPDFNPREAIERHAGKILSKQMAETTSLQELFRAAVEAKDFAQALPSQLHKIFDRVANNEVQIQVKSIDERRLLAGLQQVANRVTTGLILAALIIGAALLMRIETSFKILGYPGLAILLFLAAAAGGFALVWSILRQDRTLR